MSHMQRMEDIMDNRSRISQIASASEGILMPALPGPQRKREKNLNARIFSFLIIIAVSLLAMSLLSSGTVENVSQTEMTMT